MFKWLRKNAFVRHDKEVSSLRLYALTNNYFRHIEKELVLVLRVNKAVVAAYLVGVKYDKEENSHVALLIDGAKPALEMIPEISRRCRSISPMDVIFFEHLHPRQIQDINLAMVPFYKKTDNASS